MAARRQGLVALGDWVALGCLGETQVSQAWQVPPPKARRAWQEWRGEQVVLPIHWLSRPMSAHSFLRYLLPEFLWE